MGLSDKLPILFEVLLFVAGYCCIVWGHTLGKAHPERSGFDGPWTEEPLKFDNSYFVELLKGDSEELKKQFASELHLSDVRNAVANLANEAAEELTRGYVEDCEYVYASIYCTCDKLPVWFEVLLFVAAYAALVVGKFISSPFFLIAVGWLLGILSTMFLRSSIPTLFLLVMGKFISSPFFLTVAGWLLGIFSTMFLRSSIPTLFLTANPGPANAANIEADADAAINTDTDGDDT
ncbi:hypothetical protein K1719_004249 [Acacia pycnantha]|nr:hypothetical protein K1719_004249 [Acacia pycnantha]